MVALIYLNINDMLGLITAMLRNDKERLQAWEICRHFAMPSMFRGEMTSETVWNFCLFLRRHFMGKPTVLLQNVGCSVRPATEWHLGNDEVTHACMLPTTEQKLQQYSGSSLNGHSRTGQCLALLTAAFTKLFKLPYKLCIFTFAQGENSCRQPQTLSGLTS